MSLSHGVVQSSVARIVGSVHGTLVLEQQVDQRNRTDRGCSVKRILAAFVSDSGRGRGLVVKKHARHFDVALRCHEVQCRLAVVVCGGMRWGLPDEAELGGGRQAVDSLAWFTSAPRDRRSSTSFSLSLTLTAIMSGVQPLSSWRRG